MGLINYVGRNASIARFLSTFGKSCHRDFQSDSPLKVGFCDAAASIALLIVGPCLISARFTVGLQWLPPGRNRQDSFQVKPISHDGSALVGHCKSKECDFWSFRLVAEPNLSRFQPFDY